MGGRENIPSLCEGTTGTAAGCTRPRACSNKEMEGAQARSRRVAGLAAVAAASAAAGALLVLQERGVQTRAGLQQLTAEAGAAHVRALGQPHPAQRQMLCEGHFLDTATGIPEGAYSTLSHPGELQGYAEPLPAEMRAAIDAQVFAGMDSEAYRFSGCIDDDRMQEVQNAVGEAKGEHRSLATFAAGAPGSLGSLQ